MSQATISIRVDQSLKNKFDSMCEAFGISASAAFNIFMRTVVRERRIPFEIRADESVITRQKAWNALEAMRHTVAESGFPEPTLDEINEEIKASRNARR